MKALWALEKIVGNYRSFLIWFVKVKTLIHEKLSERISKISVKIEI